MAPSTDRKPTALDIARIEEARQAEMTVETAQASEPVGGGWMSYGGPDSWMNQAVGLGLSGPVNPSEVDRLITFYTSRGIEPKIELCPFADQHLVTVLSDRGFRIREFENVMARHQEPDEDLRSLHPHGWPDRLEIVTVDASNADQVDTFIDVSTSGFREPGAPVPPALRNATLSFVRRARSLCYLAMLGSRAVGGAAIDIGRDASCLLGTSVLRDFRQRGVQTALMIHRREEARRRGISLACIHSRPGIPTERNAARLGFSMAYTKAIVVLPGKGLKPSP